MRSSHRRGRPLYVRARTPSPELPIRWLILILCGVALGVAPIYWLGNGWTVTDVAPRVAGAAFGIALIDALYARLAAGPLRKRNPTNPTWRELALRVISALRVVLVFAYLSFWLLAILTFVG